MKFELNHADTCLPDFWSGHHLPYVQIPVYRDMSMRDIKSSICSELAQGCVMGSTDNARLLSADFVQPNEEIMADRVTRAAYAAVNRLRPAIKGQRKFFTDIEEPTDDCFDSVYAYFVFVDL